MMKPISYMSVRRIGGKSRLSASALRIEVEQEANTDDVEPETRTGIRSAPFDSPERRRIAVKMVTTTGMEMTAARTLGELQP